MVAEEDHDRALPEPQPVQRGEHAADLRVHEGNARVVGAEKLPLLTFGESREDGAQLTEADGERRGGRAAKRLLPGRRQAGRLHGGRQGPQQLDREELNQSEIH